MRERRRLSLKKMRTCQQPLHHRAEIRAPRPPYTGASSQSRATPRLARLRYSRLTSQHRRIQQSKQSAKDCRIHLDAFPSTGISDELLGTNTATGSLAGTSIGTFTATAGGTTFTDNSGNSTFTSNALPGSGYTQAIPGSAPGSISGYQEMESSATGAPITIGTVQPTPASAAALLGQPSATAPALTSQATAPALTSQATAPASITPAPAFNPAAARALGETVIPDSNDPTGYMVVINGEVYSGSGQYLYSTNSNIGNIIA